MAVQPLYFLRCSPCRLPSTSTKHLGQAMRQSTTLLCSAAPQHLASTQTSMTHRQVSDVRLHCLNPAGGASGIAESLVLLTERVGAHTLVLGCRGMGTVRATLASLAGLGSVSDYCLKNARCPVAVVHTPELHPPVLRRVKVMVALDDSAAAHHALQWAATGLAKEAGAVHLVTTVVLPADEVRSLWHRHRKTVTCAAWCLFCLVPVCSFWKRKLGCSTAPLPVL